MPSALPSVADLVERFDRNRAVYRAGQHNEAQLRREFLAPLFETLGWDMTNKQGHAEAYKEVIHKDGIKVGGATSNRPAAPGAVPLSGQVCPKPAVRP